MLTSQPTGFGESLGSVPRAGFSLGRTSDLPSVRVGMTPVLSPQPTGDVIVSFPLIIPKMIPLSVSYLCRRNFLIGVSTCLIQIQLCT